MANIQRLPRTKPGTINILGLRKWACALCLTCGYNLTGNVSGVCPECGEKIPPTSLNSSASKLAGKGAGE